MEKPLKINTDFETALKVILNAPPKESLKDKAEKKLKSKKK